MGRFVLKTKDGEIINTIPAETLDEAAELFAKIKSLTTEALLEIYNVEIFNDKK
jgi:hypothetical protein